MRSWAKYTHTHTHICIDMYKNKRSLGSKKWFVICGPAAPSILPRLRDENSPTRSPWLIINSWHTKIREKEKYLCSSWWRWRRVKRHKAALHVDKADFPWQNSDLLDSDFILVCDSIGISQILKEKKRSLSSHLCFVSLCKRQEKRTKLMKQIAVFNLHSPIYWYMHESNWTKWNDRPQSNALTSTLLWFVERRDVNESECLKMTAAACFNLENIESFVHRSYCNFSFRLYPRTMVVLHTIENRCL